MSIPVNSAVLGEEEKQDTDLKIKKIKRSLEKYYYFRFGISFSTAVAYIFSDAFILSLLLLPLSFITFMGLLWRLYLNIDEYKWLKNKHLNIQLKIFLNTLITIGGGLSLVIAAALVLSFSLLYVSMILPIALSVIYGGKFFFKTFQAALWFARAIKAEPGTDRADECWGRTGKYGFSALYCFGMLVAIALTTFTGIISGGTDKIILTFGILMLASLNTFYDPMKDFFRKHFWSKTKPAATKGTVKNNKNLSERTNVLNLLNASDTELNAAIKEKYPTSVEFVKIFTTWHKPGSYEGKFGYADLDISIKAIKKYCALSNSSSFEEVAKNFIVEMIQKKLATFESNGWNPLFNKKNKDKKVFLEWFVEWIKTESNNRKLVELDVGGGTKYPIENMSGLFKALEKESEFGVNIFSSNFEGKGEIEALFRLADTYFKILSDQSSTPSITPCDSFAEVNQLNENIIAQPSLGGGITVPPREENTGSFVKKTQHYSCFESICSMFSYKKNNRPSQGSPEEREGLIFEETGGPVCTGN
jgi:hypothetical protein